MKTDVKLSARKRIMKRINGVLNRLGVKYEIVKRGAIYYNYYWKQAHKKIDLKKMPGFGEVAAKIIQDQTTLLDYDRLYTLWQAVLRLPSISCPLVEIGTYRGGSARFIIESLEKNGFPNKFFVFDTFEGHALVDPSIDGSHRVGTFANTSYERVKAYLSAPNVTLYKGNFLETADQIKEISNFGMVHIDVDVYPVTKFCLEFFASRTIPGSVIVVDDYGFITCKGAKKAVDEFVSSNSSFNLFHLLTGQALIQKIK